MVVEKKRIYVDDGSGGGGGLIALVVVLDVPVAIDESEDKNFRGSIDKVSR